MAVLECALGCGSKVESNHCCGSAMNIKNEHLSCNSCKKQVNINRCCGKTMNEKM